MPTLDEPRAAAFAYASSTHAKFQTALLKGPDRIFSDLVNFRMKLEFYHIWQLGGYGMVQNDATGCGNHFHTRPGNFRKFTFGLIFEPLLNLCWTFAG